MITWRNLVSLLGFGMLPLRSFFIMAEIHTAQRNFINLININWLILFDNSLYEENSIVFSYSGLPLSRKFCYVILLSLPPHQVCAFLRSCRSHTADSGAVGGGIPEVGSKKSCNLRGWRFRVCSTGQEMTWQFRFVYEVV